MLDVGLGMGVEDSGQAVVIPDNPAHSGRGLDQRFPTLVVKLFVAVIFPGPEVGVGVIDDDDELRLELLEQFADLPQLFSISGQASLSSRCGMIKVPDALRLRLSSSR